jgi:predicted RecA/RadA family phage recombinase
MAQTAAIFRKEGDVIDYTPTSAVAAGEVVVIGSVPLIAPEAIAANTQGVVSAEGVWDVPKTSDVFTAGDAVYWDTDGTPVTGDATSGAADNSAATGELMGWATANAANTASYVRVKMTSAKRTATIAGSVTANDITGSDSSLGIVGIAGNASAGGALAIAGGAAAAGAYDGGAVTITGGAGPAAGNTGGAVTITSGAGDGTNGTAGAITIDSGAGATKGAITIGTNAASVTLGKMPRVPFGTVSAAGGNIATAGALAEGVNLITNSDNAKGVILPSCVNGAEVVIINMVTDKTLLVYPPVAKQVNLKGANNAITVAANTVSVFWSEGANAWYGHTSSADVA